MGIYSQYEGVEVARFEEYGEKRVVSMVFEDVEGGEALVVREDVEGPNTRVAYGEDYHRTRVELGSGSVTTLDALLPGEGSLAERVELFFSDEETYLMDLMDLLDASGVPYGYESYGPETGPVLRNRN